MTKPITLSDLSDQITQDRVWRLKEISDLKSAIRKADVGLQRALMRALVTICYAHWEGYIRNVARKYLEFVARRKFQYKELTPQFVHNYFLPRLASLSKSGASVSARCILVDQILNCSELRFSRVNQDLVNTRHNLSFDVFSDICLVCGIPSDQFKSEESFINLILLKRRNEIAHGEDTLVGVDELDALSEKTIDLMRSFGNAIDNDAVLEGYKAA